MSTDTCAPKGNVRHKTTHRVPLRFRQIVVLFKRVPHKVIRIEGDSYVVAKMQRSMISNAPTYYVPPEAIFFSKPKVECNQVVAGQWMEDEFTLSFHSN